MQPSYSVQYNTMQCITIRCSTVSYIVFQAYVFFKWSLSSFQSPSTSTVHHAYHNPLYATVKTLNLVTVSNDEVKSISDWVQLHCKIFYLIQMTYIEKPLAQTLTKASHCQDLRVVFLSSTKGFHQASCIDLFVNRLTAYDFEQSECIFFLWQ